MISADPGIWIAAFFTIAATSYVFRDNPAFKFAEHTFVGCAAGYSVAWNLTQLQRVGLTPMMERGIYTYLIPIVLGLTVYFQYSTEYRWIARYGVAFMMGQARGLHHAAQGDGHAARQRIGNRDLHTGDHRRTALRIHREEGRE